MLVPYYLMACYVYYVRDSAFMSDGLFDDISKQLLAKWETIQHWHKELITLDDLRAGTGYALQYPARTVVAAERLLWMKENGELPG